MKKQVLNFKQMSKEDIAKFLCNLVEEVAEYDCCDYCPAQNECHIGHTGFLDWVVDENV